MTVNFMNKYFGMMVCLLLILGACKREAIPTVSRKDLKNLALKEIDFDYLTTRSKINFDNGDNRIGATANIRMKKDSIIWFSITPGFGIEAARGLVTQDSLYLMNRLEKNYYAYSFQELSQKLSLDLSYDILQSALLGDMIRPISRRDEVERKEHEIVVLQKDVRFDIANFINKENLKLTKVILQDKAALNSLTLDYGDFQQLENNTLPYSSVISASYQDNQQLKTTTVGFKHNKAEFSQNALRFPFDIPDKYDRKN